LDVLFERIAPLLILVLGFLIRRLKVVDKEAADVLIKLSFNVFVPATILLSLLGMKLSRELIIIPVAGAVIALLSFGIGFLLKGFVSDDRKTQGSFILGCGMTNQAMFSYPFFLAYLGAAGLSYVAFYDLGQALIGFSVAYFIAASFGSGKVDALKIMRKIMLFPFIWAFALGLLLNYFNLGQIIEPVNPLLKMLGSSTAPVTMLALGIFLEPRIKNLKAMTTLLSVKFIAMPILAIAFVTLLSVQGLEKTTIILASTMPSAMTALFYSVEEKLDTEFCAAYLSAAIIIGVILTPVLFSLLT
jgi:malate permease and related proteins